jgi:hypothetical protein
VQVEGKGVVSVGAQWQEADGDLVHTGSPLCVWEGGGRRPEHTPVCCGIYTRLFVFSFSVIRRPPSVVPFLRDSNQFHSVKEMYVHSSMLGNGLMHKAITVWRHVGN